MAFSCVYLPCFLAHSAVKWWCGLLNMRVVTLLWLWSWFSQCACHSQLVLSTAKRELSFCKLHLPGSHIYSLTMATSLTAWHCHILCWVILQVVHKGMIYFSHNLVIVLVRYKFSSCTQVWLFVVLFFLWQCNTECHMQQGLDWFLIIFKGRYTCKEKYMLCDVVCWATRTPSGAIKNIGS